MIKQFGILLCTILLISGCVSTKGPDLIDQDYETVVFDDGITLEESIFIAKKRVKLTTQEDEYNLEEPNVMTDFDAVPHNEEFWFIYFHQSKPSGSFSVYMVVIRKSDGKIVFSRSHNPQNEWVLEATLLKLYEKTR